MVWMCATQMFPFEVECLLVKAGRGLGETLATTSVVL